MIRGCFVGVDRFMHPAINDLNGAVRDAQGMWALFTDSLPGASFSLLIDAEATAARVSTELKELFIEAAYEDTVIFFFAGHGTPSHRLVLHDTTPENLGLTSIAMDEVALWFKECKAKVVTCFLDCCFSGQAPARVMSEGPIPRSSESLQNGFTGTGRYLFTASADDESAWEDPKTRQGLFTKALLDALQKAEVNADLGSVLAIVMDEVRATCAMLGVRQTPHVVGAVAGGLGLPQLRPGIEFERVFPELAGATATREFDSLRQFGIPDIVTDSWTQLMPGGLNELQLSAINEKGTLEGNSLLVVAPTSAGKTLIGEIVAAKAIADGKRAVFLLPYKALANEKFDQFTALYSEALGMRVVRCTGDYSDQSAQILKGKYDIGLFTYEMFLQLALSNPAVLNQLGLVVLDEAHFIVDPMRGISVELLLTLLISARDRGIEPQVICLSAVVGGVNQFDKWLDCASLVTTARPVELTEGVIDRSGTYQYLSPEGVVGTEQLIPPVRQRKEKASAQDLIVPLVSKLVAAGEQVIVFRNQRGPAQGCSVYLARELGLAPATEALDLLPSEDLSAASQTLREALRGGTAFHTSNLTREERAIVERAYRNPRGGVRVLAATTTVAAGINTPASTVILAEQEFLGEDGRAFTVAEYKNMAGRAGRLGFQEKGKAIIYAETPHERQRLFQRYVQGQLEELRSSFREAALETWVMRLLSQVGSVPRTAVPTMLANTYGGFLESTKDPSWRDRATFRIATILDRMLSLGLLDSDGDQISLSLIGRACGRSGFSFESTLRLVELIRTLSPAEQTIEQVMVLIQSLPEFATYTPVMKRGHAEAVRVNQASARFGSQAVSRLQRNAHDSVVYWARCKRAAILGDWIDGVALASIEQKYSPNPFQGTVNAGDIRSIADTTRLFLRPAAEVASLIHVDGQWDPEVTDDVLRRLEVGLPAIALDLTRLVPLLDRGTYLRLWQAGLVSEPTLRSVGQEQLRNLVGKQIAKRIVDRLAMSKLKKAGPEATVD
ncbi:MAG: DEAD/DEAH box helicase [Armatimonadetes bacterium]|nr:DEAD/DEAH box helicase [Armatimonadota bacterium]